MTSAAASRATAGASAYRLQGPPSEESLVPVELADVLSRPRDRDDGSGGHIEVIVLSNAANDAPESAVAEQVRRWASSASSIGEEVAVTSGTTRVVWNGGRVLVRCDAADAPRVLEVVREVASAESVLRAIEGEVAAAWPSLERDLPLTFGLTPEKVSRADGIDTRAEAAFARRMRLSRALPLLSAPGRALSANQSKLSERLREALGVDDRAETLSDQLEAFEHAYEVIGQRMSDFGAAHHEVFLERVIIALLAAEVVLSIVAIWLRRA